MKKKQTLHKCPECGKKKLSKKNDNLWECTDSSCGYYEYPQSGLSSNSGVEGYLRRIGKE